MKSFKEYLTEEKSFARSFALQRGKAWQFSDSGNATARRYNLTSLPGYTKTSTDKPITNSTDDLATAEKDATLSSENKVQYVIKHPITGRHFVSDEPHPTGIISTFFNGQKIPPKLK